ncbi:inosine-uridine nucleoside N-ribohydrolase [Pseudorhodoferax soli]|uniref:Inosine-uridine nucleoside N-ribohydrolase n=2 Tax=Pseudorhodoferax soli TaxID=545864 RepID=A0A368XXB3_9BURK|nr:inosine-uridine nucleoside N-ribohydrolase [Pseudorhodoferax soli]
MKGPTMQRRTFGAVLAGLALALQGCGGSDDDDAPKIIIDSDYNTMSDDGQLGVMAAQLQAEGKLQVLGITVVSGNKWLDQGVAEALKSMERLGMGQRIPVYAGENYALSHDWATIEREIAAGAENDGYYGAWSVQKTAPTAAELTAPSDGFATTTTLQAQHAVDFLIDSIKANPREVVILAIGPLTNIAKAMRKAPEIVPLIKQIIYMGGAVHVPGNTTKTAEFNWWFDPEAAQYVVRQPVPQVVVPLDVTDTVLLTTPVYNRIAHGPRETAVTKQFKEVMGPGFNGIGFEGDPNYTLNVWDTLTIAYLMDPAYATEVSEEYVDVVNVPGAANNGQSIGYATQPAGATLQKMKVVKKFDNARFFEFYVDLLTRPVPIP